MGSRKDDLRVVEPGEICAATTLELELMSDHSVRITLRCDSAYEASVLFHEVSENARGGSLVLDFGKLIHRKTE